MANKLFSYFALLIAGLGICGPARSADSPVVREFATRTGISVKAIVTTPSKPIGQVILLPGGEGDLGLDGAGKISAPQMADNFTVRTRAHFVDAGYSTIVVDTALDVRNVNLNTESFRNYAADIRAIAATLKKESELPLFLVGTSASSWRLVIIAPRLHSEVGISGIVLTSSTFWAPELFLQRAEQVKVPVLIVHHRADGCQHSSPDKLQPLIDALKSAPKKVVWIEGGDTRGDPCHEWGYHGFNGKESEAVGAILNWLKEAK